MLFDAVSRSRAKLVGQDLLPLSECAGELRVNWVGVTTRHSPGEYEQWSVERLGPAGNAEERRSDCDLRYDWESPGRPPCR